MRLIILTTGVGFIIAGVLAGYNAYRAQQPLELLVNQQDSVWIATTTDPDSAIAQPNDALRSQEFFGWKDGRAYFSVREDTVNNRDIHIEHHPLFTQFTGGVRIILSAYSDYAIVNQPNGDTYIYDTVGRILSLPVAGNPQHVYWLGDEFIYATNNALYVQSSNNAAELIFEAGPRNIEFLAGLTGARAYFSLSAMTFYEARPVEQRVQAEWLYFSVGDTPTAWVRDIYRVALDDYHVEQIAAECGLVSATYPVIICKSDDLVQVYHLDEAIISHDVFASEVVSDIRPLGFGSFDSVIWYDGRQSDSRFELYSFATRDYRVLPQSSADWSVHWSRSGLALYRVFPGEVAFTDFDQNTWSVNFTDTEFVISEFNGWQLRTDNPDLWAQQVISRDLDRIQFNNGTASEDARVWAVSPSGATLMLFEGRSDSFVDVFASFDGDLFLVLTQDSLQVYDQAGLTQQVDMQNLLSATVNYNTNTVRFDSIWGLTEKIFIVVGQTVADGQRVHLLIDRERMTAWTQPISFTSAGLSNYGGFDRTRHDYTDTPSAAPIALIPIGMIVVGFSQWRRKNDHIA